MKSGKVKFFDTAKGYGFIKENVSGVEYFVHISGISDQSLKMDAGEAVSFDVTQGKKGEIAVNVERD
jgi:CspA family cold shock protein